MMSRYTTLLCAAALCANGLLNGCGSLPPDTSRSSTVSVADMQGNDVVVFALGLVETEYRFGGKNPDAGLDCSGMVNYVFDKAAGVKLGGSAADIARKGRAVSLAQLRPGDLVFFNTSNRTHSHVGIYIGDQRFVHAPSKNGKVRTDSLKVGWFAERLEEARTYFD
jgi:cell wall-associated NlpC family hydrolase